MNLRHSLLAAVTLVTAFSMAEVALAWNSSCPRCGKKVDYAIPEEKAKDMHCYEVECRAILIPHSYWPWQQCREPRCGRVIRVNVLKKVEYEGKHCGYRSEISCADGGCGGVGQEGIDRNVVTSSLHRHRSTSAVNLQSTEGGKDPRFRVSSIVSSMAGFRKFYQAL